MVGRRGPPHERFMRKVPKARKNQCWNWLGGRTKAGYGVFRADRMVMAHRFAYELWREPIPDGLEIDHLCRNVQCVNPWHLEPVTRQVNAMRALRKTHCKRGHPFNESNTYITSEGRWACRECSRLHSLARRSGVDIDDLRVKPLRRP